VTVSGGIEMSSIGHRCRITRIIEQSRLLVDPQTFFPDATTEQISQARSQFGIRCFDAESGQLAMCVSSYLVEVGGKRVLVDGCIGNNKNRDAVPSWHHRSDRTFLDTLARAGVSPQDIDMVLCTHLHADHVGWNTQLVDGSWVPTFPNAKYVMSEAELEHWLDVNKSTPQAHIADSVLPVVKAGQASLVQSSSRLFDEVSLIATPGHTADHFSVLIDAEGASSVLTGDVIHSLMQLEQPALSPRGDSNRAQGAATRKAFLSRFCGSDTLVCTAHIPVDGVGLIRRQGITYRMDTDLEKSPWRSLQNQVWTLRDER
jgi:glyoxylase-like metal-dependent hydrolase (beta-lactamase superfamily II)